MLVIIIYIHTDMIGMIIEDLLLQTLKNLLEQHMQLKYLFLAGNNDLVGGYPLSDLIYPPSFSKDLHQKI